MRRQKAGGFGTLLAELDEGHRDPLAKSEFPVQLLLGYSNTERAL